MSSNIFIQALWQLIPIIGAFYLYKKAPLTSKNITMMLVCSLTLSILSVINTDYLMEVPYLRRFFLFFASLVTWLFIWNAINGKNIWHIIAAWLLMFFRISSMIAVFFYSI